jgi:hypothetical protein
MAAESSKVALKKNNLSSKKILKTLSYFFVAEKHDALSPRFATHSPQLPPQKHHTLQSLFSKIPFKYRNSPRQNIFANKHQNPLPEKLTMTAEPA